MDDYNVSVLDNCIPTELRERVWEYLKTQTWFVYYKYNGDLDFFKPEEKDYNHYNKNAKAIMGSIMMPRALLASDETEMRQKHPIIGELWDTVNQALGGNLEIKGAPEKTRANDHPDWLPHSTEEGLTPGWRVYSNGQPNEKIKRSHGIHRDNSDLSDETSMTILCVVNPEWYPTWFAENVFYAEDPEGTTGDYQQFQKKTISAQDRKYNVGWPKKIVSPLPGRIIAYDSRCLHTTKPASEWATIPRIVIAFRARRKT